VYEKLKDHFDPMKMKDLSHWETINLLWSFSEITCILDYETEGLRKITRYPDDFKFDLIIWDSTGGQCLFPLVEKFGRPPMIAINPFINQPNTFKNIWQSYIPFMTLAYTDHMSLWQRLESVFLNTLTEVSRIMFFLPRQLELATMYFGRFNLSIEEIERDVSLMLSNHNPVFNYVEALPPNVIPVGGLHIQPKTLPKVGFSKIVITQLKEVLGFAKYSRYV
jgi:glucuronosyltransferase